ncbi:hypothetical protein K6V71_09170 [Cupriavidus gilardii]|uniref:hypothetical protein n=1 Tax=Cupriavidus gilardii TaxID=82541 RepID=UPI0021B16DD7|nr:hypothetical protein [Cupriavidus gilardii]UXC34565.1 hypothetical protein N4G38_08835 [Cupriavidus gilardii]
MLFPNRELGLTGRVMILQCSNEMANYDHTNTPMRRRFSPTRIAEILFGGLAKGTLAVMAIGLVVLAVLSGDVTGLTGLPDTRRQWAIFAGIVAIVAAGAVIYYHSMR